MSIDGHNRRLYTDEQLAAFVQQERPFWAYTRKDVRGIGGRIVNIAGRRQIKRRQR